MDLKWAVGRYLDVVKEFGHPMPLSEFQLSKFDLEAMLAAWDEDYHLHRHLELISSPAGEPGTVAGSAYLVHGNSYNAIVFKESILHVLD